MQVKVIAYGIARDIIGGREWLLNIPAGGCSVADATVLLKSQFPAFDELSSLRMAINEEYVCNDDVLQTGDELVLIPPVSGG